MTNASELLEEGRLPDESPETFVVRRKLARQVTQLEAQLKLAGNRLRAAAVNEVAKSGQTREYYEYSEWADEIDALLTKEPK